jgi:DNA-binding transcriptional ArsR family regulator
LAKRWRLLSNHGLVLACILRDPEVTLREVSLATGLTERAVYQIVHDLEEEGLLARERRGRRNVYRVHWERIRGHEPLPGLDMGWLAGLLLGPQEGEGGEEASPTPESAGPA